MEWGLSESNGMNLYPVCCAQNMQTAQNAVPNWPDRVQVFFPGLTGPIFRLRFLRHQNNCPNRPLPKSLSNIVANYSLNLSSPKVPEFGRVPPELYKLQSRTTW